MQKAYSRINWENEPSENTPLGANNLNKVDMALNTIDDRVLSLYGYEGRVAVSEQNAKASENNAKASETNAKQSELKAKEYADRAFSGTPEGYEQLVEDVRLMDIKTTTETTLANSKQGGYKLVSMAGASVQNGTPTPDTPIAIENVGDCVEMIQGAYSHTSGEYVTHANYICNKNTIPCNGGDLIKIADLETSSTVFVVFYNESGYVSYAQSSNVTETEFTVPSGATKFGFDIGYTNITPDTVGKISLTINGKCVVQIPIENKNLWEWGDVSGINAFGTNYKSLPIGTYTISYVTSATSGNMNVQIYDANGNRIANQGKSFANDNKRTSITFTLTSQGESIRFYSDTQTDVTSIQLERGEVMTDYEEHKETVATVLLNAPLRESDVMSRTEVARKRASIVVDGSEEEPWATFSVNNYYVFYYPQRTSMIPIPKRNGKCICSHFPNHSGVESIQIGGSYGLVVQTTQWTTLAEWKAWLQNNPITVEYELAEEVIEELDTDSQIALNSLETFDTVTYINVDSRVQPSEIKGEYGTSKVGARTIKNELRNDKLEIKYNELETMLVAIGSGGAL